MTEHRRFVLQRDTDITGVSGTGVVAEGVEFSDGCVALRWTGLTPTSVVFHDRGMDSVDRVHGHSGATRVVWLDPPSTPGLISQVSHVVGSHVPTTSAVLRIPRSLLPEDEEQQRVALMRLVAALSDAQDDDKMVTVQVIDQW